MDDREAISLVNGVICPNVTLVALYLYDPARFRTHS
jgi:hypothetical protein